ncbi:hypothetical protein BJ875DRAFT_482625 [Amylocarpus encephaloides]|uniref:Uncharacterized protein n=1 Tax=Amylocarpus encephaloides TaxID=45428 RepID=A0A9P7YM76_9HELO|nr:hypothetical protein BJ875DRAFT_482625 [Amylocarpus encephaloides]
MAFKWIRNLTVPKKSNYALSSLEHEEASWAISSDTCEYHAEVGHMAILQLGDAAEQDPEWNITRNKDLILMEPALLERHEIHRIREAQKPKDDFWVVDQQYFVLPFLTFLPFAERLPALDFWSQDDECTEIGFSPRELDDFLHPQERIESLDLPAMKLFNLSRFKFLKEEQKKCSQEEQNNDGLLEFVKKKWGDFRKQVCGGKEETLSCSGNETAEYLARDGSLYFSSTEGTTLLQPKPRKRLTIRHIRSQLPNDIEDGKYAEEEFSMEISPERETEILRHEEEWY